jgi:hypothetical protein
MNMRLVAKKYADGGELMVETTEDGGVLTRELGGRREVGKRISAYLEVMCDNDEKSADRLLEAISWLRAEVERRRATFAEQTEQNKTKKLPGATVGEAVEVDLAGKKDTTKMKKGQKTARVREG